jgi:plastocyanin
MINSNRFLLSAVLATSVFFSISAQEIKKCGIYEATIRTFGLTPERLQNQSEAFAQLERETELYNNSGERADMLTIPVVFHIIHNNGPENILASQIHDALEVVNKDFNALNEDLDQVVPAFADITGDVQIQFKLARKDPNGICHSGINRIMSDETYIGGEDMKLLIQWPRNKYLNIWVCAEAGGAAGYSLYPSSVNGSNNSDMDGIVIKGSYTGSIGTSNNYRSRVLSHEIGHWLNLRHLWGNSNSPGSEENCENDDNVSDTPNSKGWTICNLEGISCGSLDNVQNYMEYAYCGKMFTEGQKTRLRAAALSMVAQRNQLSTQGNLIATGVEGDPVLCEATFSVDNNVICVGDSIHFIDESFHEVSYWSWDFADGISISGSEEGTHNNLYHVFNEAGTYEVVLTASNGFESLSSDPTLVTILSPGAMDSPAVQGFEEAEFPSEDWFITDLLNDGGWEMTEEASFSGSRSLHLANWENDIEFNKDFLISSTMDLSEAVEVRVRYRWAYCFKGTSENDETDDRLRVSVTGDCGNDWDLRKMHRGYTSLPSAPPHYYPFVPENSDEWNEYTLILDQTKYLTPNFRVMFEFESRLGNDIYLDDINITAYDSSMLAIQEWSMGPDWNLFPNPSDGESTLSCTTVINHDMRIVIYDALGRQVKSIFEGSLPAGNHNFTLSSANIRRGTYFIVVDAEGVSRSLTWLIK